MRLAGDDTPIVESEMIGAINLAEQTVEEYRFFPATRQMATATRSLEKFNYSKEILRPAIRM